MTTQKAKTNEIKNVTKAEAEGALFRFAQNESKKKRINARLADKVAKLYEDKKEVLETIEEEQNKDFEIINTYASENRAELFVDKKSIKMRFGSYGFRSGTFKADILDGFTWDKTTELLREHLPECVNTTYTADKKKIVSEKDNKDFNSKFAICGLTIKKDESFFLKVD